MEHAEDRRTRTAGAGRLLAGSRRPVHAASGAPGDERSLDALLDEVAEHDTVVLGPPGVDLDSDDPRARIPAWEDIVFGVRRNR